VAPAPSPPVPPVIDHGQKLPLCPLKKPKVTYKLVAGKRVKVKPAPCRARPKAKAAPRARGGHAITVK
jgi:hypothetical protein